MNTQIGNMVRTDLEVCIFRDAARLGVDLEPENIEKLAGLCLELKKWNRIHNLTGHDDLRRIASDMIADSLVLAPHIKGGSILDIGSGAGFPGLPLALALPGAAVTLLEGRGKRVSFQKHIIRLLELGSRVEAVEGRAGQEELGGRKFANVTLRAVTGLEESLQLAGPYLERGGRVLLPRGMRDLEKARKLGLRVEKYVLPGEKEARLLVMGGG